MNLRVLSLQASNILRLSAVKFDWKKDENVLTLGGKNGAGKSSVMNAIAAALGGMALCPDEPLKRGEARGFVELNLDGLVVRREFWRDLLSEQTEGQPPAYGETKSRLVVKNAEGVKQEPAQRLLDRLIDKRTIDPVAFANADELVQANTLRQIIGLDTTILDEKRSIAFERRAVYNRQYKEQLVLLDAMPLYDDAPAEEISLTALNEEMAAARATKDVWTAADAALSKGIRDREAAASNVEMQQRRLEDIRAQIALLETQCKAQQTSVDNAIAVQAAAERAHDVLHHSVIDAYAHIADTAAITARMHAAEDTNSKVRANVARRHVMDTVVKFQKQAEEQDALLKEVDAQKEAHLRGIKFPVEGLGINHANIVTFNNIALKQASTAEQIRVSVAIGFALNPSLKLLCVKNGNALDEDSFNLVADAAHEAGGQVLMEVVTKNAGDVSVFIEDGHNA